MYKEGLFETTDDNTNNREASLRLINYEKVNILDKENDLTTHNKKIFTKYIHKIQICEENIKLLQMLGYISIVLFFLMIIIKFSLTNHKELKFYYLVIPAIFSTFCFSFSLNYFLRLKQLLEKEEEDIIAMETKSDCSFGNILSYLCLNFINVAIIIFFFLIALKLENKLPTNVNYNIINIPLYISIGIIFFYFIFLLPAFILNRYYWGIFIIASYLINSSIFLILISMKLDHQINLEYLKIFIPFFIAIGIQLLHSIYLLFLGEHRFLLKILELLSLSFILGSIVYLAVILDTNDFSQSYKVPTLFLFSATLFSIEKITNIYISNDDFIERNEY